MSEMTREQAYRRWKKGEDPHNLAKEMGVTRERMRRILEKLDASVPLVDRIEELEAKLGDLGAIKEKAHRQGYEQGKAAGDAFGSSMRAYVERLEAERDALQAKLDEAVARAEVAEATIASVSDDALDKAIDASRALIAKMRDRTDDQWRRG